MTGKSGDSGENTTTLTYLFSSFSVCYLADVVDLDEPFPRSVPPGETCRNLSTGSLPAFPCTTCLVKDSVTERGLYLKSGPAVYTSDERWQLHQ